MKIQTKTTILFTLLTATIFLILNITVYFFIRSFAYRDFNKRLELRARLSAKYQFEKNDLSTPALSELQKQYLEKLPDEEAVFFPFTASNDDWLKQAPKEVPASYLKEIVAGDGQTVYHENGFRHFAGLLYRDDKGTFIVLESATNRYGMEMMQELRTLKILQFITAVIIIYTVGLYFSRKTFQPIRHIINRVQEISHGNLHLRLQQREGTDEIAELSSTFNEMLNRLETAFEAQNNFISNASHELRTPLTAIIAEADLALSKKREPAVYEESLKQIAQQAEKLQTISKGLLALAQIGFNGQTQEWRTVRLDQLLYDVKEDCDALLPGNNLLVSVGPLPSDEEGVCILGNYDLLKIAINNIVLNACKYSHNQSVLLQLHLQDTNAVVTVKDQGIGIPDNELQYIYVPFFRASNTKTFEGYGIGMPLSNNIVRLHKGSISVNSIVNKGTEVKVKLPLV